MADDACLFCGLHGEYSGGHLFIGKRQEDGSLKSDTGWICIEHQSDCTVQICPGCAKKVYLDPSKLTVLSKERIENLAIKSGTRWMVAAKTAEEQLAHTKKELTKGEG